MAGWIDLFSLVMTMTVFGGTIYGVVYVVKQVTESIQTTQAKMKDKGYDISRGGVSIKTSKRFDRQDYIDATQRGMLKTMTAASFNKRNDSYDGGSHAQGVHHAPSSSSYSPLNSANSSGFAQRPATMERATSNGSVKSAGSAEKKKMGLFTSKKNSLQ